MCWRVDALAQAAYDVGHVSSTARGKVLASGHTGGVTRWGQGVGGVLKAWIEWDWVEAGTGLVVQADPLNVRSNVLLLDCNDRPVLSSRRRAMLATLTYLLPWHGPVLEELRRNRHSRYSRAPLAA